MHVRLSSSKGLPVVEQGTEEMIGFLSGILLNPDSSKVEGFYVRVPSFLGFRELFCSSLDISRWGMQVELHDREVLAPAGERIRLQPLLEDGRTILGQRMRTKSGVKLGMCKDVQFDTDKMRVTWLFPKRFMKWGVAVPISEVIEVTKDAVIVNDPPVVQEEREETMESVGEAIEKIKDVADPGIIRPG